MQGVEGAPLAHRLRRDRGFDVVTFHYRSVHESAEQIVGELHTLLQGLHAPRVHLLGHSLGGSIVLHCLTRYPMRRPGRVVLMGAPVLGSRCALSMARWAWARRIMGRAVADELMQPPARLWDSSRELGIIAGNSPFGLGRMLIRFDEPNDGTVAVSETRLPGATASIELPLTHSGMLWSARAAREAGSFLAHGRFSL
jgi:pimeloyl-ACP methyl ester carboxylesterase